MRLAGCAGKLASQLNKQYDVESPDPKLAPDVAEGRITKYIARLSTASVRSQHTPGP